MFSLPAPSSPLRALFDADAFAEYLRLPTFNVARQSARSTFAADALVRRVHAVCVRGDSAVELVAFGPKGGHTVLWRFGRIGH